MLNKEDYLYAGTLIKTHGVHGSLVLALDNLTVDKVISMEPVFLEVEGLLVPFFVSGYSEMTHNSLLISFDDITTPEEARKYVECRLYTGKENIRRNSAEPDLDSLTDYQVIDSKYGAIGKINDVVKADLNTLLAVSYLGKEIFIPVHPGLIDEIDSESRTILVSLPEGLLDL